MESMPKSSHTSCQAEETSSSVHDFGLSIKDMMENKAITEVPHAFRHKSRKNEKQGILDPCVSIPVIDMTGVLADDSRREEAIRKINDAATEWGVFYLVNHGIGEELMTSVLAAVEDFHGWEGKKSFDSKELSKTFKYYSNIDDQKAKAASWSDTLDCVLAPGDPADIPDVCRDRILQYANAVKDVGMVLFELLSESLGLVKNHLKDLHCDEGFRLLGHYYPTCPDHGSTLGSAQHTDSQFLTILLQDQIGGLQIFHSEMWIDVPCIPGALIVNVGDFMQLVTNDIFKAVYHRVLVNKDKPRKSVACFFGTHYLEVEGCGRYFEPIHELVKDGPPLYRKVCVREFMPHVHRRKYGRNRPLAFFKFHTTEGEELSEGEDD